MVAESASTTRRAWAILGAMGLGALVAQMFSTVIGPALPTIQDQLDLNLSLQTWAVTAYSLTFGAALIAGGRLADLYGEVRLIVIGYAVFGVGLVASAIAGEGLLLVAGRAIQGAGIGISAPATLSIVVHTFPAARRGTAVGIWGSAHGLGLLLGPLVAGYAISIVSWRWIFWLAVPITALVIAVTLTATKGYRSQTTAGRFDIAGLLFGASGIVALVVGLQNASNGWGDPLTWAPLAGGAVLLGAFFVAETRVTDPLVDLSLFRNRMFAGAVFGQSALGFAYIPVLTFVGSLYLIGVLGLSPLAAGWVLVLCTGTTMVVQPLGGRLVDAIGARIPMVAALVLLAVGLGLLSPITPNTSVTQLAAPLVMIGVAIGAALPAFNTAAMSSVDSGRSGMASGIIQMTFNLPAALGVAVITSIVGSLTLGRVEAATAGSDLQAPAMAYSEALEMGDAERASTALAALPDSAQAIVREVVASAEAGTIGASMALLAFVVLASAGATALITRSGQRRTRRARPG